MVKKVPPVGIEFPTATITGLKSHALAMWPTRQVLSGRNQWSVILIHLKDRQHMSRWPQWLGVRLQSNDGCCWEFNFHLRQLFFS